MAQLPALTRFTHEELLRHLLSANQKPDENTIYSFLLGYRLYQSPNQLLNEIYQRTLAVKTGPKMFYRQNAKATPNKTTPCSKCISNQRDSVKRKISKSTNNMLDEKAQGVKAEGLYADLAEHKALVNASIRGRKSRQNNEAVIEHNSTSSDEGESEFDGNKTEEYVDLDKVFADETRRFTAPAYALDKVNIIQKSPSPTECKGTDFSSASNQSQTFVSTKFIHIVTKEGEGQEYVCADGVVASGEDTIRRRRKGRRRPTVRLSEEDSTDSKQVDSIPNLQNVPSRAIGDCRSVASRDSGILSACADDEEEFNNNLTSSPASTRKNQTTCLTSPSKNFQTNPKIPKINSSLYKCDDSGIGNDDSSRICNHDDDDSIFDTQVFEKRHLLSILTAWVKDFPADFRNKKIRWALNNVTSNIKSEHSELTEPCEKIVDTLSRHIAIQENFEQKLRDFERKDAIKLSADFKKTKEWMSDILINLRQPDDANRVAKQLCLIEMDLLQHVGAEEFLQMFTANGDEDTNTNLGACVRWFNHLSHLVATSVCLCRKVKHRRHVISLFSRAASVCYEMSNFNSAMAVLTGLNLGAVARLTKTWNKLGCNDLDKLQNIFDPSNNFRKYRSVFNERCHAFQELRESELKKLNRTSMASNSRSNRFSTISQHSVTSRTSVASQSSQHRDSGIECETDHSPPSGNKHKEEFTFENVHKIDVKDGVLIPFLTLLVKDVYFLNHSTPTVEASGNINFEKLRHLGELLRPLEAWKQNPCGLKKDEQLAEFLMHSPVMKDAELYLLSYKREPPRNRFEKNQLKSLRSEFETKKRTMSIARRMSRRKTM